MSKAAHTLPPWVVFIDDDLDFLAIEDERDGKSICEFTGEEIGVDEARENFDLIVRAVNSHAALVATLENILEFMEDKFHEFDGADCDPDDGKLCPKCESNGCIEMKFKQIRAALKLAESDQ